MVAALSPADINYDETLSTLRCVPEGGGPGAPTWLGWESGTPVTERVTLGGATSPGTPGGSAWVIMGPVPFTPPAGVHSGCGQPGTPVARGWDHCACGLSSLHSSVGCGSH